MSLITNKPYKVLGNPQHRGKHLGLGFKILVTIIVNIRILSNNNNILEMILVKTNINSIKNPNISNRTLSELVFWTRIGTLTYILDFLT